MMRSLLLIFLISIGSFSYAQRLQRVEYFIDTDPGFGLADSLAVGSGFDSLSADYQLSTAGLSPGLHSLYIRSLDTSGVWSTWSETLFFVEDTINYSVIDKAEYFIDTDSGFGNVDSLSFTVNDSIEIDFTHDISSLSEGTHFIHVRQKMLEGIWSPWQLHLFYIEDTINAGSIQKVEYFVDEDQGFGQSTAISITPADSVESTFSANVSALNQGRHYMHVRQKVATGLWSPWQLHLFYVEDTLNAGSINKVEYFVDEDQGFGQSTAISITPADSVQSSFSAHVSALSQGRHYMHVRQKVATGLWSPWQLHLFYVEDTSAYPSISTINYAIDSGLLNVPFVDTTFFNPAVDSFNLTHLESLDTTLTFGQHFFRAWAIQQNTLRSTWHKDTFIVIDCPMLDTAAVTVTGDLCHGDSVVLKQNITSLGIWPSDSFNFSWVVNGSNASTADSLKLVSGTVDSFFVKFSFARKSDARCKGELTTQVIFESNIQDTIDYQMCTGDSVLIHGVFRTSAGTYTQQFSSAKGCDSTSVGILTVAPSYNDTISVALCQGDSILVHGIYRKAAGTFVHIDTTINGCDSLVTAIVQLNPIYSKNDTFSICQGDTLKIHGKNYITAGTYMDSFTTLFGCDSVFVSTINIKPTFFDSSTISICQGDSVQIHGVFRTAAGAYTFTGTATNGCDSTSIRNLIVKPSYSSQSSFSICQGDSVLIHGTYQKIAGNYIFTGTTTLGCDSIVTVTLQVNPTFNKRDTFTICQGDTLKIHGKNYTSSGSFIDSFTTTFGCDSIFQSQIFSNPVYRDSADLVICQGDSALIHGVYRKASSTYIFNGTSAASCDSISIVRLAVNPIYSIQNQVVICHGDSALIHGSFRSVAGNYVHNGQTSLGCDSIVTTNLTINPSYYTTDTFAICQNDSLLLHGKNYLLPGTYVDSFSTIEGCDSIFTTVLKLNPTYSIQENRGICQGDSLVFDGISRTLSGVYTGFFKTVLGCDSTVVLNLVVDSIVNVNVSFPLCDGDSVFLDGAFRKMGGTYTERFIAAKGCDSLVHYNVHILSKDTVQLADTICAGGGLLFDSQSISQPGLYNFTFSNKNGCDSIVQLLVVQRSINLVGLNGTICFGDSVLIGNGFRKGNGFFIDTLIDRFGCDSIINYTQTELPLDSTSLIIQICSGDSIFTGNSFKLNAGQYLESVQSSKGCDSLIYTQVNLLPTSLMTLKDTFCFNTTYSFFNQQLTQPGVYTHFEKNIHGCDSLIQLSLTRRTQFKPRVISPSFAMLTTEDSYVTYQWYRNREILVNDTLSTYTISQDGEYDVRVSNSEGCFANSWDEILGMPSFGLRNVIVYPNPARDIVNVESPYAAKAILYNANGSKILDVELVAGKNVFHLGELEQGLYSMVIFNNDVFFTKRILILK